MGRWLMEVSVPFDPFQMVGYIPLRGGSLPHTDPTRQSLTDTDPNARPRLPTHAQHTPGPHVPPRYSQGHEQSLSTVPSPSALVDLVQLRAIPGPLHHTKTMPASSCYRNECMPPSCCGRAT